MNHYLRVVSALLLIVAVIGACSSEPDLVYLKKNQGRVTPEFSADSAYNFIVQQLEFGPRVPNTQAHRRAADWKINLLKSYAGSNGVYAQRFRYPGYDGDTLELVNIIAAFNPTSTDRIMLCAHWDTRPRSDADTDPIAALQPVLGADDGGSGVAVLLELARLFRDNPPPFGVDIILFDGEDYGREGDLANYFLGSRYWAQNPPVPGYQPRFGLLLDMVGGKGARFPKEVYSMNAAPSLVNELWSLATEMGYADLFPDEIGLPIQDDHVILNQYTSFKTIDIIHHRRPFGDMTGFPDYWHTSKDNLEIIDKNVLGTVGNVMVELIYNRL
jgi:glutaminyl-peptide cyclotransferase